MFGILRMVLLVSATTLCGALPAPAGTLRCQSINGNLNCAGSDGASCQTVNGRTTCMGGHGDVLQSFGSGHVADDQASPDDQNWDRGPPPAEQQYLEHRGPRGRPLLLERDGTKIHRHSDRRSVEQD